MVQTRKRTRQSPKEKDGGNAGDASGIIDAGAITAQTRMSPRRRRARKTDRGGEGDGAAASPADRDDGEDTSVGGAKGGANNYIITSNERTRDEGRLVPKGKGKNSKSKAATSSKPKPKKSPNEKKKKKKDSHQQPAAVAVAAKANSEINQRSAASAVKADPDNHKDASASVGASNNRKRDEGELVPKAKTNNSKAANSSKPKPNKPPKKTKKEDSTEQSAAAAVKADSDNAVGSVGAVGAGANSIITSPSVFNNKRKRSEGEIVPKRISNATPKAAKNSESTPTPKKKSPSNKKKDSNEQIAVAAANANPDNHEDIIVGAPAKNVTTSDNVGNNNKQTRSEEGQLVPKQRKRNNSSKAAKRSKPKNSQKSPLNKKKKGTVLKDTNAMAVNDEIVQVKTAKNCAQRWQDLFKIRDCRTSLLCNAANTNETSNDPNEDAFDCSDLIIPPAYELVNREVEAGIERWKDLASRVIVEEDGPTTNAARGKPHEDGREDGGEACGGWREEEEAVVPLRNHELLLDAATSGDKRKHRLLPYNFDYMCKKSRKGEEEGVKKNEDNRGGSGVHHCPKVISLLDPTKTLDYDEELWHVFKSVKTSDELERLHALGNTKRNSDGKGGQEDGGGDNNRDETIAHGCQHTLAVRNNLKRWNLEYSRLDAHSLGRLRIRDRHCDPLGGAYYQPNTIDNQMHNNKNLGDVGKYGTTSDQKEGGDGTTDQDDPLYTTIRFEVLKHCQNLKRGSGSDGNRMEVEMHGSHHTLLDLHRFLVECALGNNSYSEKDGGENVGNDDPSICPGVFFIENAFYTCGGDGANVGQVIQHWLDHKEAESMKGESEEVEEPILENEASSKATIAYTKVKRKEDDEQVSINGATPKNTITQRRIHLGLSSRNNFILMSKMKLEDLPQRLGIRYFHMFVPPPTPLHLRPNNTMWNLANESAVFITGIHTHHNAPLGNCSKEEKLHMSPKPPIIIHDTWATPQRHFCLACKYSLASVVTVNDPLTDAMPLVMDRNSDRLHLKGVPMCSACYRALHYQPNNPQGGEKSSLELRPGNRPSLVFPIEDYQRMVVGSSLDEAVKTAGF